MCTLSWSSGPGQAWAKTGRDISKRGRHRECAHEGWPAQSTAHQTVQRRQRGDSEASRGLRENAQIRSARNVTPLDSYEDTEAPRGDQEASCVNSHAPPSSFSQFSP